MATDFNDFVAGIKSPTAGAAAAEAPRDFNDFIGGVDQDFSAGGSSQLQGPMRYVGLVGNAVNTGLANTAGLPGNLESLYNKYVLNPLTGQTNPTFLPTTADTLGFTNKIGLTGNPAITPGAGPYPNLERYGTAAISGAASALPLLATGGAALPLLASGAAGSVAAQGASDLMPNVPYAPLIAGTVAGLGVGGASSMIEGALAQRTLNQTAASTAATAAGTSEALASARLANPLALNAARDASRASLDNITSTANADAANTITAANGTIKSIADSYGSSTTPMIAGGKVQDAARDWMTNTLPAKLEAAKEPLNMIMGTSTLPTSLNNLRSVVGGITESGGALDDAVKLFRPQLPDRLQKILDQVTNPPLTPAEYGVPRILPPPPSWQDVDRLQTEIGRAMSNSRMVADTGQENLSNMYRAISDDKRAALAATGNPDALSAFDSWNTEASRLLDFKEGTLSKVVAGPRASSADPAPEDVIPRLGASDLQGLRQEIPSAVDEITSAHLRGDKNVWSSLSPEEQEAMVPDPTQRTNLDSAVSARDSAQATANSTIALAKKAHQDAMNNTTTSIATINRENTAAGQQANLNARNAAAAANAGKPGLSEAVKHMGSLIVGEGAGGYLGVLGHSLFPGLSEFQSGAVGGLAGLLAPPLIRGITRAPIAMPMAGAVGAASNPLLPTP